MLASENARASRWGEKMLASSRCAGSATTVRATQEMFQMLYNPSIVVVRPSRPRPDASGHVMMMAAARAVAHTAAARSTRPAMVSGRRPM
jgi:hypothetical protein